MNKSIKISALTKETVALKDLTPFQEDIKTLGRTEYEKLRENILQHGFSFAVHVWKNKGKTYIIDGHQRIFTLKQMEEIEGYKIPKIPVVLVEAKNFKEAKAKVLAGASQYGRLNEENLFNFIKTNDLKLDGFVTQFDFPELDISSFTEKYFPESPGVGMPEPQGISGDDSRTASEQVRQVPLLFDLAQYEEFLQKVEYLMQVHGKTNITEAVLEAVRADYKAKKPKSR